MGEWLTRDAGDLSDCRFVDAPILEFELASINLTLSPANYMRKLPMQEGLDVGNAVVSQDLENAAGRGIRETAVANASVIDVTQRCSPRLVSVDMPAPLGPNVWILGEPMLQKYYTIFDWNMLRVGFSLANSRRNTMRS